MTLGFGGDNFYVLLIVCEEARALYCTCIHQASVSRVSNRLFITVFNTIFKKIENERNDDEVSYNKNVMT